MGSCSASTGLLKAWFSWLKGSFALRLVGLPTAVLLVHLEIFGSSPAATSLILHRLARRLRLSSIACMLQKDDAAGSSSIFVVGGADVMNRAQSLRKPKLASTLDDKDRTQPSALGGVPSPRRLHTTRPPHHNTSSTTSRTSSPATTPSRRSPSPSPTSVSASPFPPASATLLEPSPPISARPTPPTPSAPASARPSPPVPTTPSPSVSARPSPRIATTPSPPASPPVFATPFAPISTRASPPEASSPVSTTTSPRASATPSPPISETPPPPVSTTPSSPVSAKPSSPVFAAPSPVFTTPFPPLSETLTRPVSTTPPPAASSTAPPPVTATTAPATPAPRAHATRSYTTPHASATMPSHTRSASSADIVRQGKRLSLQFPIQPTLGHGSPMFSPRSRPQSWVATPASVPSPEATSVAEINILAVIAAQERYVLELKEELAQAERDLKMLKGYHASQESMRQLNESRKVTQLKPLDTSLANFTPTADDEDGSSSWMMKEMERRKALLSATKSSQRKVFSGSRHLRTLSLLSPDTTYTPSFPQPHDLHEPKTPSGIMRPPPLARSSTTPDVANQIATNANGEKYDISGLTNMQRDALLRTGKRMATDFKDGLLTFIEDIRQATVGEDAMGDGAAGPSGKGPAAKGMRKPSDGRPPLQRSNTSSKKSSTPKLEDIGDDFWRQHGLSEPKTSTAQKKTHASKHTSTPQKQPASALDDFEDWDSWDTPNDKTTHAPAAEYAQNSSDESDAPSSPVSHQASSRTSTRYHSQRHDSKASSLTVSSSAGLPDDMLPRDAKRNSIPWPDLVKLSPTNLKRTASHLMKEWEKNLTPPPEARDASHASGDYIGRTVSPE